VRLSGRPVGRRVRGPSPSCAIATFVLGALTCDPGHSRGQEGGGSAGLFAFASFGQSRVGAPLADAFSASRMRTFLEPSRSSKSVYRTVSTSDIPWLLTDTPESVSVTARCASLVGATLAGYADGIDLPAIRISPRLAGKGKTHVDPRTPSVVSRTCRPKPADQAHV
jgi:hypothetical protein